MTSLLERIRDEVRRAATSHGPPSDRPFAVLSHDEISKAEEILGLRLPPLLKQLYLEVGNGGFGPGHGLLALIPSGELHQGRFVVDLCRQYQKSKKWNLSVLPFASWGCGILSCLDLSDNAYPPVYRFEPNMPAEVTRHYLKGSPYRGVGLIPQEVTLSAWLSAWLDGQAEQMFNRVNMI